MPGVPFHAFKFGAKDCKKSRSDDVPNVTAPLFVIFLSFPGAALISLIMETSFALF